MKLNYKKYKTTEVGLIPNDWDCKTLNNFLELLTDYDANGSFSDIGSNTTIFDSENFAWYVRATDLEKQSDISCVKYVDEKTYKYLKKSKLFGGEVLITKRGEIGKVYFFEMKTNFATLAPNLYLLKLNDLINPFYLFSFFKSSIGQKSLIEKNASTTLGALYKDDVKSIFIPIPPTKTEQILIATALSDADSLISSLEKLIEKKRAIKQGAMQQLLKPKEGWVVKKLGELFEITSSKRVFQSEWRSEGIPFYRARELAILGENGFVDNQLFITKEMYESYRKQYGVPEIGDMLVTGVGTLGKTYVVKDNSEFYFKDGNIIWFKIRKSINSIFLQQLFLTNVITKQIENLSSGTTVGTYTITGANKTVVPFPTIDEQNEIANILTDMDVEIISLEKKLEKQKMTKQGMMQALLTGKIRLI